MNLSNSVKHNKNLMLSILSISLLLIIGQFLQADLLFDRIAINSGQWWKVISGNFTHSNIPHLLLNLSGLWMLALLFIDNLKSQTFIFSIFFLSISVGVGLFLFTPEIVKYYGFSGVLYGLYFVAAINAVLNNDVFTGLSVAILIAGKICWDVYSGGSQASAELIGVPVANDAHLYGFIGALLISIYLTFNWFKSKKRHPPTFR